MNLHEFFAVVVVLGFFFNLLILVSHWGYSLKVVPRCWYSLLSCKGEMIGTFRAL